jgi:hypothetical protein
VALLKLVVIRAFTIIEDLNPDRTEGIKLLNKLTAKAPITYKHALQQGAPPRGTPERRFQESQHGWQRPSDDNRSTRPFYFS